jgi:hypothetical protein
VDTEYERSSRRFEEIMEEDSKKEDHLKAERMAEEKRTRCLRWS